MTAVAFLGLGAIGTPMARHLATPDFSLRVWNRTAAKAAAFAASHGATHAETPADAANGARFVVTCLPTSADVEALLETIAIEDVWGIGRRLARWCRLRGVAHARALRDMPAGELRRKCGVVGLRLQQELQGHACLPLISVAPAKQETCVSRSFSEPVATLAQLREAIATYLVRAAEKLRQQRQRAGAITVFARTSPFAPASFYSASATVTLPLASNDTAVLLQAALGLVPGLYRPHKRFAKAGVLLQELQPETQLQHHLLAPLPAEQQHRREALMQRIDALNRRYGQGSVQWGACGLQPAWSMRRQRLSAAATTRLTDLPTVWAR